jgi:dTMP kinase
MINDEDGKKSNKCKYVVIEGVDGIGKSTQTQKLVDHLRSKGCTVLQTKEPGTPLSPLTMSLRSIVLDKQYDEEMTAIARELLLQAIRSIHMERVIVPALYEYDFIVQDRGTMSGLAYGMACENNTTWLWSLVDKVTPKDDITQKQIAYDHTIYLKGDPAVGLSRALNAKQEFVTGDAMEAKGNSFMSTVASNMDMISRYYNFNTSIINVDGKDINEVFADILRALDIGE